MPPFSKLLIANRGEIARRIQRSAHALGLRTVAVHSDADAHAPFVREADEAVRIGPAPSAESYLDRDRLLGAAWRTGAEAIHPGYGFLAENAAFRRAVDDAGLIFVGPSAEAIRVMGSKVEARRLATAAGVPVVPGFDRRDASDRDLAEAARAIGYPVLVKADMGGGGKGMRACRDEAELLAALESARREAEKAFGDASIFLERLIERPRHIEVQVLGDGHGHLVHLGERECSIQRRHQKVIEESPSAAVDEPLRAELTAAALRLCAAIGYESAGTVEFVLAPDRAFYFLEMNTRLQVEHPVTELVTGLDLVALQLKVALGEALGIRQEDVRRVGHAIEARLCAEDPADGYLPQTGRVVDWSPPRSVRVDGGVEAGSEIGIHYDSLLAKVVAHGADRREAARRLARGLRDLAVQGVTTNRDHLIAILEHPDFLAGDIDTGFLQRHADALRPRDPALATRRAALAALVRRVRGRLAARQASGPLPGLLPGYRSNRFRDERERLEVGERGGASLDLAYRIEAPDRLSVGLDGGSHEVVVRADDGIALRLAIDGVERTVRAVEVDGAVVCQDHDGTHRFRVPPRFPDRARGDASAAGGLVAAMPGQVRRVLVTAGQEVAEGQSLIVLESMKMETTVRAPRAGAIGEILVREGDVVEAGRALIALVEPATA